MNMNPLFRNARALLAVVALGGSVARADLLSTESFSGYTVANQIQTTTPSPTVPGYTGNWTGIDFGTARPVISSGSLTYSDPLYLGSSGNSVGVPSGGGETAQANSGRVYRLLDTSLKVTDSTVGVRYLSFLFVSGQETGATTYQMLSLYDGSTADAARNFDIGITTNGGLTGTQYNFGVDNSYTNTGVTANTAVHLLVVKFSFSATAGQDSVTVWVDPALGAGEPAGGTTVTGKTITFDRLALSDYDANSAAWDEIRWATTFDDATLGAGPPPPPPPGSFVQDAQGVTLETASGLTRVEIWGDRIARVLHTPTRTLPSISSLAVTASPEGAWQFQDNGTHLLLTTPSLTVRMETTTGQVRFYDAGSTQILAESVSGTTLTATTVGSPAVPSYVVKQAFDLASGEAIYGLGQQQSGVMNWVGQSVVLQQKNMYVGVPVLLSNKGYSVLWDNPAVTTVDAGKTAAGKLSWSSEAGDAVNYYFCYGP